MKNKLVGSIILNCLLSVTLIFTFYYFGVFNKISNRISSAPEEIEFVASPYYLTKDSVFSVYEEDNEAVVFLGDSMIDIYDWEEAFADIRIINQGINSDTTIGVLNRLDNVIEIKPDKLFLMIGTNDLNIYSHDTIVENYEEILSVLHDNLPNSDIFIQSILPVNESLNTQTYNTDKINDDIYNLNQQLKQLASRKNATYVDLYSTFVSSGNGNLDASLTIDGLHLNNKGYELWINELEDYIQ